MTAPIILSVLDVALADALAKRVHFPSGLLVPHAICCRICGVIWHTAEEWAKDTGYCPGYVQCGQDPVPTQPLSVGPIAEPGW